MNFSKSVVMFLLKDPNLVNLKTTEKNAEYLPDTVFFNNIYGVIKKKHSRPNFVKVNRLIM